jgi:integrase
MKRVSPHMLRATAITHALDQGASHRGVQQMAGWTSPLMITRYDKRRKDPKQSAVHKLKYAHRPIADAPTTAQTTEQSL